MAIDSSSPADRRFRSHRIALPRHLTSRVMPIARGPTLRPVSSSGLHRAAHPYTIRREQADRPGPPPAGLPRATLALLESAANQPGPPRKRWSRIRCMFTRDFPIPFLEEDS